MNSIILCGVALMVLSTSITNAQQSLDFRIALDLKGTPNGTEAYLLTVNEKVTGHNMFIMSDTVGRGKIKQGKLTFSGQVPAAGKWYGLYLSNQITGISMLLGQEDVSIKGNFADWPNVEVIGSEGTTDLLNYKKVSDSLTAAFKSDELLSFRENFIINNPNSLYATFLILRFDPWTLEMKQDAYDMLTPFAKSSYWGKRLKTHLAELSKAEQ